MPTAAADKEKFSPEDMKDAFCYDPETGLVTHRTQPARGPSKAGDVAGCVEHPGRIRVRYKGHRILAHRIAWAIYYGEWPRDLLDHANGNGLDNRIANLREATHSQNMRNRKTHKHSKTGVRGVAFEDGSFRASITTDGKRARLGFFQSIEAASAAYMTASESIHGAFGAAASRSQSI